MKKIICFVLTLFLCIGFLPLHAYAATREREYSRVGEIIPEIEFAGKGTGTATQGMALVGDYAYIAKLKGNAKPEGDTTNYHLNEPSVMYRINIISGETVRMTATDAPDGLDYVTYLHHANGMGGYELDGKIYILVVTLVSGEQSLVKLQVEGTTYRKVGEYKIMEGGKAVSRSGMDILSVDGEKVQLLLKSGEAFSTATLPHSQSDGEVVAVRKFTIDLSSLTVGDRVVNATPAQGYARQDCGYRDGILYVVMSGPKSFHSIIGVFEIYNEDGTMKSGSISSLPGKSIWIEGGICNKIEIESVAVGKDGRVYFNANANSPSGSKLYDGLFVTENTVEFAVESPPVEPTPVEPTPTEPTPADPAPSPLVWALPIGAAVVISIGCVAFVLIKKKKQ